MKKFLIGVLLASVVAVGCGGGGGGSKTPTAPSITSVNITTEGNMLWLGNSVTLAASANTGPITGCTWGGDAPTVATVNAGTGQITGVGSGEVTVWCDYQGVRGTKRLRVIPNYGGVWLGSYAVTGCNHSGIFDLADWCDDGFPVGRAMPLRFDFSQTTDSLSGRTSLGDITSDAFVATVRVDGTVQVRSHAASGGILTVDKIWNLNQRQAGRIEGNVSLHFEHNTYVGDANVTGNLYNTNKQFSMQPLLVAPPNRPTTLEDLLRAIGGR